MRKLFQYKYQSEIIINAPRKKVWEVLSDFPSYKNWNPFTVQIDTSLELGSEVFLTVKMKPGKSSTIRTEYLRMYAPEEKMVWGFSHGLILKAQRTQRLVLIDERTTRYENEDKISGLLSPLVQILYGKWIQRGFDSLSLALKEYIENGGPKK